MSKQHTVTVGERALVRLMVERDEARAEIERLTQLNELAIERFQNATASPKEAFLAGVDCAAHQIIDLRAENERLADGWRLEIIAKAKLRAGLCAVLDAGEAMLDSLNDEGEFDVGAVYAFSQALQSLRGEVAQRS